MDNFGKEQLIKRYLEDPYLKVLRTSIADIYQNSVPRTLISDNHGTLFVFEPRIDFRIKELQKKIFEHIANNYSELISTVRIR